jgi:hypothetical protein
MGASGAEWKERPELLRSPDERAEVGRSRIEQPRQDTDQLAVTRGRGVVERVLRISETTQRLDLDEIANLWPCPFIRLLPAHAVKAI